MYNTKTKSCFPFGWITSLLEGVNREFRTPNRKSFHITQVKESKYFPKITFEKSKPQPLSHDKYPLIHSTSPALSLNLAWIGKSTSSSAHLGHCSAQAHVVGRGPAMQQKGRQAEQRSQGSGQELEGSAGDSSCRNPTRTEEEGFGLRKETKKEKTYWQGLHSCKLGLPERQVGSADGTGREHWARLAETLEGQGLRHEGKAIRNKGSSLPSAVGKGKRQKQYSSMRQKGILLGENTFVKNLSSCQLHTDTRFLTRSPGSFPGPDAQPSLCFTFSWGWDPDSQNLVL